MSRSTQITTTDSYQTIFCPKTVRVTFQSFNASIAIGYGQGTPALYSSPDEVYAPSQAGLARTCDEIRIKSAIVDTPGVIFLTLLTAQD
jgi:hypothetical protein